MEVIEELLGVSKYKIYQTDDVKFSVDSLLLASFVTIKKQTREILDLGTGNAPIPLYLTLRTDAHITGVEIQSNSYELAKKSVKINMKEDQISLLNMDLKDLDTYSKYDTVVSNPPFFKYLEGSHTNPSDAKAIQRHEIKASLDDIVAISAKMLKNKGIFAMIHRPDRLTDILVTMRKYHIEPKRIRFVYPYQNQQANHVLIEGMKNASEGGIKVLEPLYIYEDGKYTKEIRSIYNGKEW